jgi:hypothetical protein
MPQDFPRWNIEQYYFQIWGTAGKNGEASLFDRVLQEPALSGRVIRGGEAKTTMIIMDSKSVKTTSTACEKGYEAGKKLQAQRYASAFIPVVYLMRCGFREWTRLTGMARLKRCADAPPTCQKSRKSYVTAVTAEKILLVR